MDEPLLSILIPAYRYPEGVARILAALGSPGPEIEIVVSDDSPDDAVARVVAGSPVTRYRHNRPALGAVRNWNRLLDEARGEFCLLLHHDEAPVGPDFVRRLLGALVERRDSDVLMLGCDIVTARGRTRAHVPAWLRRRVVARRPGYLFRRNVVGPVSTIVVRRSLFPRFDERLRWLVDVEAYWRLFSARPRVRFVDDVRIVTHLRATDSISANLQPRLGAIVRDERSVLWKETRGAVRWLAPGATGAGWRAVEAAWWAALRLTTREIPSWLSRGGPS